MKDLSSLTAPEKPEPPAGKPFDVKIIQVNPMALPNKMGGMSTVIFGLGSDSKMYQWYPPDKDWIDA